MTTTGHESWGEPRSRVVSWYDPLQVAAASRELSGLEVFAALLEGRLPPAPISALMQMQLVAAEHGRVEFTCAPDESAYNPIGAVHGGLVCTLLDTVAGCAVHTTLAAGTAYTSVEIKVSYLRPVLASSGTLTATGRVVKGGRRVAFAEGSVTDGAGRAVATATSTLLVFPVT